MSAQKRILIVRLSALGDTALTLPLAAALRRLFPSCHIGWVVGAGAGSLVEDSKIIDKIHILKKSDKNLRGYLRLAKEIKKERYDISLDAQSLTKSAMLPFLARIKTRVGFARYHMGGREVAPLLNNKLVTPPKDIKYISSQILYLLSALDIEPPTHEPITIHHDPSAKATIDKYFADNNLTERTLAVSIGAGWHTKILSPENILPLVESAKEQGIKSVILWGPAEREQLDNWRKIFEGKATLAPDTSVREMTQLIGRACAFAGPDTGSLHIAALLGKPTFSWFGASDEARCAPVGEAHRIVARDVNCRPCWKRSCPNPICVTGFETEELLPPFIEWLKKV